MRNFSDVADRIIEVIKNKSNLTESKIKMIVSDIEELKRDSFFRAPELQYMTWNDMAYLLNSNFDSERSDWEKEIQLIFSAKK